jgi:hypothetical protein
VRNDLGTALGEFVVKDSRTGCGWAILRDMSKRPRKAIPEIPRAVLEKFLGELGKEAAMADVVARLKPVLLADDTPTEATIRAALLPDDPDGTAS